MVDRKNGTRVFFFSFSFTKIPCRLVDFILNVFFYLCRKHLQKWEVWSFHVEWVSIFEFLPLPFFLSKLAFSHISFVTGLATGTGVFLSCPLLFRIFHVYHPIPSCVMSFLCSLSQIFLQWKY